MGAVIDVLTAEVPQLQMQALGDAAGSWPPVHADAVGRIPLGVEGLSEQTTGDLGLADSTIAEQEQLDVADFDFAAVHVGEMGAQPFEAIVKRIF